MTKSTITRERIQRIIRAIDSEAYDEEEIREWLSSDEIMELSRMALSAMDSEPVRNPALAYADSYRDMQLLYIARCNILANSSFSWWGAYLNQRKNCFIICPHKWHNTLEYSDLYLPTWIKI